jgi:hypothetical protein
MVRHLGRGTGRPACGGDLYPNDAGYRAMAQAVPLSLFAAG